MKFNSKAGGVEITLDLTRIEGSLKEAQQLLNMQIVADCDPYVPFRQGALRNSVRYPDGISGSVIEYDSPYAHYQYEGMIYGPNIPVKDGAGNVTGWFSIPGAAKMPTGCSIQYHTAGTGSRWFETAKSIHLNDWIKLVEDTVKKK